MDHHKVHLSVEQIKLQTTTICVQRYTLFEGFSSLIPNLMQRGWERDYIPHLQATPIPSQCYTQNSRMYVVLLDVL